MNKIMKKIAMFLLVALASGVLFWVAPTVGAAQTAPISYTEISMGDSFKELEAGFNAALVNGRWVFSAQDNTLYSFDEQLVRLPNLFPEKYARDTMRVVYIDSFYDSLVVVAARYARANDAEPMTYHVFFADRELTSLWELEIPDNWIVKRVFFGPQTLMFHVGIKGTNRIELYNYLWQTKERLLVSSFTGYGSIYATSNDVDEWMIRACDGDMFRCDWYGYTANKTLRLSENLPMPTRPDMPIMNFYPRAYDFMFVDYATDRNGALTSIKEYGYSVATMRITEYTELPSNTVETIQKTMSTYEIIAHAKQRGTLMSLAIPMVHGSQGMGQIITLGPDRHGRFLTNIIGNQYLAVPGDTDGDGLADAQEVRYGSNLKVKDTDGDGHSDFIEIARGYNPNGPCMLKNYIPGIDFKYGRGYVADEVHQCLMADFDMRVERALGKDWMNRYGVNWDRYADYVFGYIYGDYPINTLIGAIKRENGFSATVRHGSK